MTVYATPEALERFLGIEFDSEETSRAEDLLEDATGEIDAILGQSLEQVESEEITLDGVDADLLVLPHWPVSDVSTVTVDSSQLGPDEYEWSASGLLWRVDDRWPTRPRSVTVTYSHGCATAPRVIQSATVRIAAAWWSNPRSMQSESIGDYSYRVSSSVSPVDAQLARVRRFAAGRPAR